MKATIFSQETDLELDQHGVFVPPIQITRRIWTRRNGTDNWNPSSGLSGRILGSRRVRRSVWKLNAEMSGLLASGNEEQFAIENSHS